MAILGSTLGFAQSNPARQSLDVQVPWRPIPAAIGGKHWLTYELHMTNFSALDLVLRRIKIFDSSGATLGEFQDSELANLVGHLDRSATGTDRLIIAPGVRAIAYLSVAVGKPGALTIRHRIEYQASGSHFSQIEGGDFTASTQSLAAIQPPLRGGPWVAVYDASWPRGHRRVPYALDGSIHIPGRFAIDWIKVDRNGKYFDGDGSQVSNWYGYGAEVIAVADGIVAATRDDVSESPIVSTRSSPATPDDASGNYVALSLGNGRFAFYEHLKPGSIRVREGERIRQGSVVGLLGYTGESTGPHLHFHMADRNSVLGAEGIPYLLERFQVIGRYQPEESFGKSLPWIAAESAPSIVKHGDFPAPFVVVDFP